MSANINDVCLSHLFGVIERSCSSSKIESTHQLRPSHTKKQNIQYLRRVQGKCCQLINTLAIAEDIARDHPEHDGPEITPDNYSELMRFVSGVGTSCGEAIERLECDHAPE